MSEFELEDRIATGVIASLSMAAGVTISGMVAIETGVATKNEVDTVLAVLLGIPASIVLIGIAVVLIMVALYGKDDE